VPGCDCRGPPPTTDAPAYNSPTPLPVYAGAFFIPGGTRGATLEMKGPTEWGHGVFNRTPEHIAALRELGDFLTAEVANRRANSTDDLITHLPEAEIDGDRLSEREIVLATAIFLSLGASAPLRHPLRLSPIPSFGSWLAKPHFVGARG
jgi:hypothetical protein